MIGRYLSLILLVLHLSPVAVAQKRPLTVEDIMKFRQIRDPVVSANGRFVAFEARPDRGDSEVRIHETDGDREYAIERGSSPLLSRDGRWAAAAIAPPLTEKEDPDSGPVRPGLVLLNTRDGSVLERARVRRYLFSRDSRWLAYHLHPEEQPENTESADKPENEEPPATPLYVRDLDDGSETRIDSVTSFEFSRSGNYLAYVARTDDGEGNGVFCRHLSVAPGAEVVVARAAGVRYEGLSWSHRGSRLAFVGAGGSTETASLYLWDAPDSTRQLAESLPEGWSIPVESRLSWSRDGNRLFVGLQPVRAAPKDPDGRDGEEASPFDRHAILQGRQVDVWHWNDPRIVTHQKQLWDELSSRQYDAVVHLQEDRLQLLADQEMPEIRRPDNPEAALGLSEVAYLRERTWEGTFRDAHRVDLRTGERTPIARRVAGEVAFSPQGRYAAWFEGRHWRLFDADSGTTVNLTAGLQAPFFDEDHDYPSDLPSYGTAGWLAGDEALLLYDKYDVWKFPLPAGDPVCLTMGRGREQQRSFRAIRTDPDAVAWEGAEDILLSAYHHRSKEFGFYSTSAAEPGLVTLLQEPFKFEFVARAEEADVVIFTREDYGEFPDLWVSSDRFERTERITEVNPQIEEFAFGSAELVEWRSLDGIPLQGVLIKPGNYEEGKRYPVVVYFYRFFSQRLHEFNEMVINHRPNFAYYASNGYAIFLPDVRFEVGRPGFSATKCLVPGVQKLVEMGVADPDAIGLHGHSWSGYQTAFVITQTNQFAAAVAGAPVSNMTSAYSGIRWQSGLARQFQYEKTQSRIGGSLWEYPERYIANSPVFFADRIETPLLIQFGDEDGAVPWYQGIELYLALRRLDKPTVMLQYRGEPHHLQEYSNKLDYTLKMREFFDHFLKGTPAPKWWSHGVPYSRD